MRPMHLGFVLALGVVGMAPAANQAQAGGAAAYAFASLPPQVADTTDPADSLYQAGRIALNRNRFQDASDSFRRIYDRYPESRYAADAMYWHAFALYKLGGLTNLRVALARLDRQEREHPRAATRGDARALATRIRGELARRGDAESAAVIARTADELAAPAPAPAPAASAVATPRTPPTPVTPRTPRAAAAAPAAPPARSWSHGGDDCENEDETRTAALSALLQMDEERARPILKKVLERRDAGSECLRRRAVFLVAQKGGSEAESMLLNAARTDPDAEVRGQAIFWLGRTGSPRAVQLLDSVARTADDPEVQQRAIHGLGQIRNEQSAQALRAFIERPGVDAELKGAAIFWLGQDQSAETAGFLRAYFDRADDPEVQNRILFSLSQNESPETQRWLLDIAKDTNKPLDTRKQALYWAGGRGTVGTGELISLYRSLEDREMREQLVFVLSQRGDREAVGQLIEIARNDPDAELRKRAVFWLSRSDDPRAMELMEELLTE